jgi:hypothetical protein
MMIPEHNSCSALLRITRLVCSTLGWRIFTDMEWKSRFFRQKAGVDVFGAVSDKDDLSKIFAKFLKLLRSIFLAFKLEVDLVRNEQSELFLLSSRRRSSSDRTVESFRSFGGTKLRSIMVASKLRLVFLTAGIFTILGFIDWF